MLINKFIEYQILFHNYVKYDLSTNIMLIMLYKKEGA